MADVCPYASLRETRPSSTIRQRLSVTPLRNAENVLLRFQGKAPGEVLFRDSHSIRAGRVWKALTSFMEREAEISKAVGLGVVSRE